MDPSIVIVIPHLQGNSAENQTLGDDREPRATSGFVSKNLMVRGRSSAQLEV